MNCIRLNYIFKTDVVAPRWLWWYKHVLLHNMALKYKPNRCTFWTWTESLKIACRPGFGETELELLIYIKHFQGFLLYLAHTDLPNLPLEE